MGVGANTTFVGAPPQAPPDDEEQFGTHVWALAYSFDLGGKPAVLRANWGLYYAQTPTIFFNRGDGNTNGAVLLLQCRRACPPGGYPNLWPGPASRSGRSVRAAGTLRHQLRRSGPEEPPGPEHHGDARVAGGPQVHAHDDSRARGFESAAYGWFQQHAVEPQLRESTAPTSSAGRS